MEDFENLPWYWHTPRTDQEVGAYFNKSFENDYKDPFYCFLNEIEPALLKNLFSSSDDDSDSDSDLGQCFEYIDPRTKQRVENLFINHSTTATATNSCGKYKIHLFNKFSIKSALTRKEQIACLHVMMQSQLSSVCTVDSSTAENLVIFNKTLQKRDKEYNEFRNFVQQYVANLKNAEEIEGRGSVLRDLYKSYLNMKAKEILHKPNCYYSIQSALPLNFYQVEEIVFDASYQIIETKNAIHCLKNDVKFSMIKEYCTEYKNEIRRRVENIKVPEIHDLDEVKSIAVEKSIDVVIPESVLLFLFCCKECSLKETWEILFTIEESEYETDFDNKQIIVFDEILPLRMCNLHNTNFIFEQLIELMSSKTEQSSKKSPKAAEELHSVDELHAIDLEKAYKLIEFDEYLSEFYETHTERRKQEEDEEEISLYPQTNYDLIQWSLIKCDEAHFEILTKKKATALNDQEKPTVNYSFKLEHKKEFGAEVMAKMELIQEWLRQFLMPGSCTERYRIDIETMEPIMHEKLSQRDIESELLRLWNTKPDQLMSELYCLLRALKNFPTGTYMLKYNPSHKNRLLVYKKTESKCSGNDISLHSLYRDIALNNFNFKDDNTFLPIDSAVITPLHRDYKILPCLFPYWGKGKPGQYNLAKITENDQSKIIEKFQKKKQEKLKQIEERQKKTKAKRKKVKRMKQKQKIQKLKTLENEVEEGFEELDADF